MMNIYDEVKKYKIVPVVVLNSVEETLPKVGALIEGGLPVAEICFRTPCAKEAIKVATKAFPDALIGAGTVINKEQCLDAIACGVKFIVSPGLSKEVAAICKENNVPYFPGVVTPTEVMMALDLGINVVKFFPAADFGGLKTIKALCAAFPQIRIMPTGGINEANIRDFLSYEKILACGGSWMMSGTVEEIKAKTASAVALVKGE